MVAFVGKRPRSQPRNVLYGMPMPVAARRMLP
jgi:hypothetical protein